MSDDTNGQGMERATLRNSPSPSPYRVQDFSKQAASLNLKWTAACWHKYAVRNHTGKPKKNTPDHKNHKNV